jgi:hypothetical protein
LKKRESNLATFPIRDQNAASFKLHRRLATLWLVQQGGEGVEKDVTNSILIDRIYPLSSGLCPVPFP